MFRKRNLKGTFAWNLLEILATIVIIMITIKYMFNSILDLQSEIKYLFLRKVDTNSRSFKAVFDDAPPRLSVAPSSGRGQNAFHRLSLSLVTLVVTVSERGGGPDTEITTDVREDIINTSFPSDWTGGGCGCGCGEGGPGIPGTLGTTVTGLTS